MTALRSDEGRRDNALRTRGIETDRFPAARLRLSAPLRLSSRRQPLAGRLTLHGVTRAVRGTARGQRFAGEEIEVVGSVPITMADFAIEPPSIAGFATVEDAGTLEFRLRFRPAAGA